MIVAHESTNLILIKIIHAYFSYSIIYTAAKKKIYPREINIPRTSLRKIIQVSEIYLISLGELNLMKS